MNPEENPITNNINVDDIVGTIKKEAKSRNRFSLINYRQPKKIPNVINNFVKIVRLIFRRGTNYNYELKDLLQYEDELFIKNLYSSILNREADPDGLKSNLDQLRLGHVSKVETITRIILSPEGERQKVGVRGLVPHLIINIAYRIPVIGYMLKVSSIVIRLPEIIYKIQTFQLNTSSLQPMNNYQPDFSSSFDSSLDGLYRDFENQFRGSKKEIFKRQSKYIQYIKNLDINKKDIVLDLGCGRGEWLKVLGDNGIKSLGVDSNRYMIKSCLENKLEVVQDDFTVFLENASPNKYKVITGFQIIEQISFASLIKLFDLCLAVLKPGGIVIFETPNPENLIVGACNFYSNPKHLNPIPPRSLQFYIKSRGFIDDKVYSPPRERLILPIHTLRNFIING